MDYVQNNNYNALKRTMLNVDLIQVDFTLDVENPRDSLQQTIERGMQWQVRRGGVGVCLSETYEKNDGFPIFRSYMICVHNRSTHTHTHIIHQM